MSRFQLKEMEVIKRGAILKGSKIGPRSRFMIVELKLNDLFVTRACPQIWGGGPLLSQ